MDEILHLNVYYCVKEKVNYEHFNILMKQITLAISVMLLFFTGCKKDKIEENITYATQSPDVGDISIFPSDNSWNIDISNELVDPNSDNLIAGIGNNTNLHPDFGTIWKGEPIGIPYNVVNGSQTRVTINFRNTEESDPGPYPIPPHALVEAGSDRHVVVVDTIHHMLYELYDATKNPDNSWNAGSGAMYDLTSNKLRPDFWTSADAAGLPIFPGLVRYEEVVEKGEINHALRFTVNTSRNAFVHPATHAASDELGANYPPMGMRVRLKASFDVSKFSPHIQVILKAMKKYGMLLADNGSDWYISGAPDSRWDDDELGELKTIKGSNFEVVKMGNVIVND